MLHIYPVLKIPLLSTTGFFFTDNGDEGLITVVDTTPSVTLQEENGTVTSHLSQTGVPRQDFPIDSRKTNDTISYNTRTESGLNSAPEQGSLHTADNVQGYGPDLIQHEEIEVTYLLSDGTAVSVESLTGEQGSVPNEMIAEEVIATETSPEVAMALVDVLSGNKHGSDKVNNTSQGVMSENGIIYELALDLKSLQNSYSNRIITKANSHLSIYEKSHSTITNKQEKENRNKISVSKNLIKKAKKRFKKVERRVKSVNCEVAVPMKESSDTVNKMSLVISKEIAGINKSACCMCNEVFDDSNSFEAHADVCLTELIHRTDSTLYRCSDCKAGFRQPSTLLRHRLAQVCQPGTLQRTGEFLTCRHCGKSFHSTRLTDYTIHLLKHKKEKAHVCDLCGKSFLRANTLRDHKRSHTGERPYICRYCTHGFISGTFLNLLPHSKIKGFTADKMNLFVLHCSICSTRLGGSVVSVSDS